MRPDLRRLLGVVLIAATVLLASSVAAPAPAQADVCDKIPSIPGVPNPVKTGCNVIGKAPEVVTNPGQAAKDIVTAPFDAAGDAVMRGVTKWVADGAGWLVGQAGKLIDATTTPRLDSPWFAQQYRAMAALAAVFALPLLLLSVLQSVLRRDSSIAIRAAFVQLPAAFLLTAGAVAVVVMFLQLTDEMCGQVSSSVGSDAGSFFKDTTDALTKLGAATGQGAVPLFAVFLGGLIAAIGAFFVWIELVLRSAAVYVTVLFLPFTFVAMVWPTTARWCRRLVELLFAVVFSKFVIVAIMALAAAGLGQSRSDEAFQGVIAGAALMMLAALSPLVLLRLIPLAEAAAHTNWRSGAGSQTLGPIAGPAATMRRVVDSNWGGGSGGSGGGLRAAPAAGAGPTGMAAAGAAGAMTGAVRTRADHAGGNGGSNGGGGSPGGDSARYAAVGGGGQAARPAAPSSEQSTPGADSGAPATAPAGPPGQTGTPGGRSVPAQRDGHSGAAGGPRPMAPGRDLSGNNPPPQKAVATVAADARRYRFGPLERRGLVGALRTGQVAVLGLGLVAVIVLLQVSRSPAMVFAVLLAVLAVVGVCFAPIAGRTTEEWTPVVLAWPCTAGGAVSAGARACPRAAAARTPGSCRGSAATDTVPTTTPSPKTRIRRPCRCRRRSRA